MIKISDLSAPAERLALIIGATTYTYGQLRAQIRSAAPAIAQMPGRVLPLKMTRRMDTVVQLYAAIDAGKIVMPLAADATVPKIALPANLPADVWLLGQTSGTSGAPKRYVRNHQSWLASFAAFLPHQPKGFRIACLTPLHYSLGLYALMQSLHAGLQVMLSPTHLAQCENVDVAYAVPSFVREYLSDPAISRAPHLVLSGEPVADSLLAAYTRRHPSRQCVQFYGSSETSFISVNQHVLPEVAVQLQRGEIVVRSPQNFSGYLTADGFMPAPPQIATGDCGHFDHGRLHVDGRRDHRINRGGEKCFPEQITRVLLAHPHIADAQVSAAPDKMLGQRIVAAIVWRGTPLTKAAVNAWLHTQVGAQKLVVDRIFTMSQLPLAASGKHQQLEVKDDPRLSH